MVVGVNGLLRAKLATEELDSTVGDDLQREKSVQKEEGMGERRAHLVDVHVGLGSGSSLENDEGEVVLSDLAGDDLRAS